MVCNYNEYNGEFFDNNDIEKVNSLHNGIQDALQPFIDANQESIVNRLSNNVKNNIKSEIEELFESNPELANQIYETLGFVQESNNIEILTSNYTRQSVQNDTDTLYLFTDNAQRTSRPTANEENVDKNSWYYKKYKSQTNKPIHFGSTSNPTSAVIRGLNNAYPISTMSAYGTNWTDSNFELFKQTIDDEIAQIKKDLSKFSKVKIGDFRIGQGGRLAKLPQQHQQYLDNKLLEIGIDNTGNKPKIINSPITSQQKQEAQQLYSQYLNQGGSKQDIQGFKKFVQGKQFQKLTAEEKTKTIEQVTKEHRSIAALKDLSAKLAHRIGGTVEFKNITDVDWKGYNQGMKSVLNEAYMTPDTPFHEILAHPIIRALKYSKRIGGTINLDGTLDKSTAKAEFSKIYQNLLKELETGRGKEVLDGIKRDYVTKEKPKSKNYNLIDSKNNSEIEIIQNFGNYWFKEYNETLTRGKQFKTNEELENLIYREQNKHILSKYTLEEQQEEAIVTLLGMMAADKLDAKKDATLISKLKELWKQISDFVKSLLRQDGIKIDELPITTTLNDLAEIMAYGNNKIILPGYKVEYSTPLGNKYDTLEEVNQEIRGLSDANAEVDLSGVKVNTENKIEKNDNLKNQYFDLFDSLNSKNRLKSEELEHYLDLKNNNGEFYGVKSFDVENVKLAKTNANFYMLHPEDNSTTKITKQEFDKWIKQAGNTLNSFIEKNKEYEQSKEIIEQWKKENNIQYDPEEVYSRGQEFYHIHNAYSRNYVDTELWIQNLLETIQDKAKIGAKVEMSFATAPKGEVGKGLQHHNKKTKQTVYITSYPKSEDIEFVSQRDNYTSSFTDLTVDMIKVFTNQKNERVGITLTKSVPLENLHTIQPNLATAIDNVAHHNEIVIGLTPYNFRINYEEEIPYHLKKLIDNFNKILDDKYGKLTKPEINKIQVGERYSVFDTYEQKNIKSFATEKEAVYYLNNELPYDEYRYVVSSKQKVYGKQPTQTKANTTSIESVKSKFINPKLNDWRIIPGSGGKYQNWAVEYKLDDDVDIELFNTEQEARDFIKSLQNKKDEEKEYTSQTLINLKVAALKEVARKYPRSLITSEVVPINPYLQRTAEIQYSKVPQTSPQFDNLSTTEQVDNSLIEKIKSINTSMQANVVTRDFNGNISIDVTPVLDKLLNRQESRYLPNLSLLSLSDNMFSRQLELLKRSLPGVEVILDSTITSKGRVEKKGDKIVIYINPEKATEDTLIHEFGHILIDILIESGNGALIETAINQLRGTALWESVAASYEHLDPDTLGKEVLATAIGLEGVKEFNNITTDQTKLRKIREFIRSILTTLKRLIGLNENVAKELSRDLLRGNAITNNLSLTNIYESVELNRIDARKLDMDGIVEALINHSGRINTKQRTFASTITNTNVRAKIAITKMISTDTYDVALDEQNMRSTAMAALSIPFDKIALTIEEEADIQQYVNTLKNIRENNKLLGINLHKLVEDIFENTVDDVNYKKYFYGNTYLANLPDKEAQLFFSQMRTKIETIRQSHPGAVFLTELAIFDETADMPTMGVIDLLVVNPDKSVVMYDLKTSNNFVREKDSEGREGEGKLSKEYMLNVYEKHAKQLYAYSAILKKLFNIDVSRQIIIPIKITIDGGILRKLTFEQNLNISTVANADKHKEAMFVKFKVLPRIELTAAEKMNSLHDIVSKKISTVTTFINALKSNKSNAFDTAELQQILNELRFNQGLQTLLTNGSLASELLKKVKANLEAKLIYHKNIEQANNKIVVMPLSDLKEFYTVLKFLKHLTADNDNLSFLDDVSDNDVKSTVKEIRKLVAQLTVDVKELTTAVETHILDTVALMMVRETEIGMGAFRRKFQSDFEEQNPAVTSAKGITYYLGDKVVSKTQYERTKRNYIAQRVEEDQDNILVSRYEAARQYINLIPRDSDIISNTVLSAAESENFIIQTLYSILRKLDIDISDKMLAFQVSYYNQMKEILSTHDRLILGVGVVPSIIYDKYIEGDHIATEYSKEFYYGEGGFIEMQKKIKEIEKEINEVARELGLVPESDLQTRKTLESKILELQNLSKDTYIKWKDKNIKKVANNAGEVISVPADHWKNPKYNEIKDDPIYKILISMVKDADALLANHDLRLTKTIFNTSFIKMPSKEKTAGENIFSGNFLQPFKSYFTKTNGGYNTEFGVDADPEETLDYELVHLDTDEKPIKNISFPYRGLLGDTLEEHTANLSHDLFTSLMANYYVSLNFANKSKAKGDIELMLNVLGESQKSATIKRNWAGDVQKVETFKPVEIADSDIADAKAIFEKTTRENTTANDKTNWYKLAEEIVEQRLLGIKLVGNPTAHAIVNIIHAVVVLKTLTFSTIGAAMNAAQIITNIFEEAGRGGILTKEAIFQTFLNTMGRGLNPFNLKNNMADFFKSAPESKIGIITTALNGYKDGAMVDFDMLTGKLTKLVKLETANFLNKMVEYMGSSIIVESYLRSLIVQDINGNDKGNLYDNIKIAHGRMVIPDGLYFHKDAPVTLEKLRLGVSRLNDIISGYYDQQEVIPAKRTWYFKTLYLYRSWAPSVLLNRFRGLFTSFKELKEGDEYSADERILYDAVLDQRLYGYETIWFRKVLIKNLKTQLSNILIKLGKKAIEQETSDAFNKLDVDEKRAIMVANRFIILRMLVNLASVIAVGLIVYKPDDDDEKEYKYLRSTLKDYKDDLKSNKKELETETNSEKIEALKKSIEEYESAIANIEAAIKNKDLSMLDYRYVDTGMPAKLGKNNDAYKKHKDSYISKDIELNINDFYIPFTGKHLPADKPLIRFDNNPENWDDLYRVATYIARYQDEISQFSLLTSVTPTNKALHLQALQPVASAGKILNNPITGVNGITTTLDMINLLSKNIIDTPSNVYQSSKSTIYGTDVKDQVRYASKDKLEAITNKMFPAFNRDYRELYKNIYAKTD